MRADALQHLRVQLVRGARDDDRHPHIDQQGGAEDAVLHRLADRDDRDIHLGGSDLAQRIFIGDVHLRGDGDFIGKFHDRPGHAVDADDVLSEARELFAERGAETAQADYQKTLLFSLHDEHSFNLSEYAYWDNVSPNLRQR